MLISIIIPCFNEEKVLESTYQRISTVLEKLLPRTAAVSETSRSIVRTASVHEEVLRASHMHCDHEPPQTANPEGIAPSSPGLRGWQVQLGTSYPGFKAPNFHNPEGVAPDVHRPTVHGDCDPEPHPQTSASVLPLPKGEGWGEGEGIVHQPIAREATQPTVLGKAHGIDYELLFVDDGSRDSTPVILKSLSEKDRRVTVIRFSRNFGHQPAVSAGLQHCRGDLAVIIDADLQDPPEVIPDMLQQLKVEKANVVYGVRKRRNGETWFKLVTAKIFYLLLNKLSDVPMPLNTGDFRVVDRKVINAFNALPENTKYIRGLISWMGFKQIPFYYEREARFAGSTKYSLTKMIRFASTGIFYFSKKPLQIATAFGFLSVAAGLLLSGWILFSKLTNPQFLISGWTSLVLAVIYFGGVQLLTIGILGQYIGNLFDEVKRRPEYIIDEIVAQERGRVKSSEMYFPLSVEPLACAKEEQQSSKPSASQKTYVTSDSGAF